MTFSGTAKGRQIDLDEALPFADGTRVKVDVSPESAARRGSPRALLRLAGTLTDQEVDVVEKRMVEAARASFGAELRG